MRGAVTCTHTRPNHPDKRTRLHILSPHKPKQNKTHLLQAPHQPLGRGQQPIGPKDGARPPAKRRGGRGDGEVDGLPVADNAAVLARLFMVVGGWDGQVRFTPRIHPSIHPSSRPYMHASSVRTHLEGVPDLPQLSQAPLAAAAPGRDGGGRGGGRLQLAAVEEEPLSRRSV